LILLDTHVWVWWVQGAPRLDPKVIAYLDAMPPKCVGVSAISCWEVAMLVRHKRLVLPVDPDVWIRDALSDPRVEVLPITHTVAISAALLPERHKDPADRILIAHALIDGHQLISEDDRIHSYTEVTVLRPAALTGISQH